MAGVMIYYKPKEEVMPPTTDLESGTSTTAEYKTLDSGILEEDIVLQDFVITDDEEVDLQGKENDAVHSP